MGRFIKLAKQLLKAHDRGDSLFEAKTWLRILKEEGLDILDALATLGDGRLTVDDIFAIIEFATGVEGKDVNWLLDTFGVGRHISKNLDADAFMKSLADRNYTPSYLDKVETIFRAMASEGVEMSIHAINSMTKRNISVSMLKRTLTHGDIYYDPLHDNFVRFYDGRYAVLNKGTGRVANVLQSPHRLSRWSPLGEY